jgi:ribokinase
MLQLEIPLAANAHAAARVRAAGGRVILDPAPVPPDRSALSDLLAAADIVTPNEGETETLVDLRPETPEAAAEAAGRLQQLGPAVAVVTMGAAGVFYATPEAQGFVPPFQVAAVDSVAAGDCFNGGLAFALARGDGMEAAVRFAAACGALATTLPGAAAAAPNIEAVEALMR